MTTFKEIDINEYKKLLDNMQHIFAKSFNNIELLHNFEENVNDKNIGTIIKDQESLQKEDKYIDKLSDKLSEKISNSNINNNNNIIQYKKKYVFLNTHDYYNKNPKDILNYIKKIYIKSNIGYDNTYKPRSKTVNINLGNIIKKIEYDDKISNELKDDFIDAYNNIPLKTRIQFHNKYYREYVMEPVERYYIEKDNEADDEKSIIVPSSDKEEDKSLKDELKNNAIKTVINTLTGQGLNFDKIKIDENLLKKNILKVRYINSNRKINNKFLKEDYKISNNMKNSILKNTGLNKLTKNEYDVYNTLEKHRKNNDNLQLLLSSYLAGNKNKDLYNKINELLYKSYRNNTISKKQYQNIMNKL